MVPTIHLNGTSKAALLDDLGEAAVAIDAAYRAVKQTAPNGRDYYPQGPLALGAALAEHEDRLRRLDAVKAEIEALMDAIDTQGR